MVAPAANSDSEMAMLIDCLEYRTMVFCIDPTTRLPPLLGQALRESP